MPSEWLPQVFGEGVAEFATNVESNTTLEHLFAAFHRICLLHEHDEIAFLFEVDFTVIRPVIERVGTLRDEGYRTGLLTNSFETFRASFKADRQRGV